MGQKEGRGDSYSSWQLLNLGLRLCCIGFVRLQTLWTLEGNFLFLYMLCTRNPYKMIIHSWWYEGWCKTEIWYCQKSWYGVQLLFLFFWFFLLWCSNMTSEKKFFSNVFHYGALMFWHLKANFFTSLRICCDHAVIA